MCFLCPTHQWGWAQRLRPRLVPLPGSSVSKSQRLAGVWYRRPLWRRGRCGNNSGWLSGNVPVQLCPTPAAEETRRHTLQLEHTHYTNSLHTHSAKEQSVCWKTTPSTFPQIGVSMENIPLSTLEGQLEMSPYCLHLSSHFGKHLTGKGLWVVYLLLYLTVEEKLVQGGLSLIYGQDVKVQNHLPSPFQIHRQTCT